MDAAGSRIDLEGNLNLRDLGGWLTDGGTVVRGRLFRSDRLADLTDADHVALDGLGIRTVIDLRYEAEVNEHPSRLWSAVVNHVEIPMAGDLANQKSFIDRAFDGDFDGITDDDVGAGYIEMLTAHGPDFGRAIVTAVDEAPSLFHCTAGKDRTGLFAMLVLSALGVSRDDILADFVLSNEYRAEVRMRALAPMFAERGLDVEAFRPALSAPRPAMEMAMTWLETEHGSPTAYLRAVGGLDAERIAVLRSELVETTT